MASVGRKSFLMQHLYVLGIVEIFVRRFLKKISKRNAYVKVDRVYLGFYASQSLALYTKQPCNSAL